jgi:hypothetical protein
VPCRPAPAIFYHHHCQVNARGALNCANVNGAEAGNFTPVTQAAVDTERAEDGRQHWISPVILAQEPIRVTSPAIAEGTPAIAAFSSPAR